MATAGEKTFTPTDLDPITLGALDAFRRRRGMLLLLRALGVGLLVFISLALSLAMLDYFFFFSDAIRWCLSVFIYAATAIAMWMTGLSPLRSHDEREIARHVEAASPNLREDLVSAVELSDPESANGSAYFRRLLQSRVSRRIARVDIGKVLPIRLVRRWLLSGLTVGVLCFAMMLIPSAQFGRRFARAALPGFSIERASRTKVTILEPSPPSGFVAERDAVGVIADVQGADPDDVILHWRSADGTSGESMMTPRLDGSMFLPGPSPAESGNATDQVSLSETTEAEQVGGRFAANLSVGSLPVEYRITAGDAITLWHSLTPLPRPRVVQFDKLYRLPPYAKLADRSAVEENGDLKALQGTIAEVTVTFDQPVEMPIIRFGVRGARNQMEPVDDSGKTFLARISIKTSGQYQVDATSVRSGLNNPFSPTNMITPVLDTPPVVRWSDDTQPTQMVSSLDVIDLAASVSDDLPMDRVVQEVQLNGAEFESYALSIPTSKRKLDLAWSWDLMNRLGESSGTGRLSAGDLVRTRLVAVDRKGARSESRLVEFLIAGDGFDANRHQFLEPFGQQVEGIAKWADQCKETADGLKEIGKSGQFDRFPALKDTWKTLQSQSVDLIKSVSMTLSQTQNSASASMTELVGRSILDVESRLDGQIKRMEWLSGRDEPSWKRDRERNRKKVGSDANQTAYQCERLSEFARARFELALTASVYSDVLSLRQSIDELVDDLPKERLPRYLTLVSGQISEIDRLIQKYEPLLSQQTSRHLSEENWTRWAQRWNIQIETLLEDKASRDQVLAVLRSLREQVNDKPQHVIQSGIHNTVLRWGRDLRKETLYLSDLTRRLADVGRELEKTKNAATRGRNADDAIESGLNVGWQELSWRTELNRLIVRTAGQERLNRAKLKVDLRYAADQNLFLRGIKNVTSNGFQSYQGEPGDKVLAEIGGAIGVLQAVGDLSASRDDFRSIRDGERQPDGSPLRKVYHPLWFKLQETRIELAVRQLRQSDIDWNEFLQPIDATRYNADHEQAKSRIDSRQWRLDPFVSAGKPLELLAVDLQNGIDGLIVQQEHARDVLRRYVLKLSEQARQAAEAANQAERETDQRVDASEESAEQAKPDQQHAIDTATETISALIDEANTSDIIDDQQREVSRDADAAAEWIAEAVQETKDAMKQADASSESESRNQALESVEEKLGDLAARLEETAEHFERIENGEDVTESRERLRRAEEQLNSAGELADRYDRAEEMADTAKQDPRALLEQLEQELKRNEPMQDALSDIAVEMVSEAARNLEQAAKEEDRLQRKLESEDRAFAEQKRQQQMMLDEFVQRAKTLSDRTLSTAENAAGWANDPESRVGIRKIREQLKRAVEQAEPITQGNPTFDEIQSETKRMQEVLDALAAATSQVARQMTDNQDKDLHGDQQKRDESAASMSKAANQLRNDELRALDQQRKKWSTAERAAGTRVRSAEQKERQAEAAVGREEKKLKRSPESDSAKRQIEKQRTIQQESARVAKQTRETRELARQRQTAANGRANAINQKKASRLEKPNPAAQLGGDLSRGAAQRMENLSKELGESNGDSQVEGDLRAASESAERLSRDQESVESDVQAAVDELARASRHETRLERPDLAEQLARASVQTQENAGQPAAKAKQEIDKTTSESDNAARAGRALREASERIAEQAGEVANLLEQGQSDSAEGADSQAQTPGEQDTNSQPGKDPSGQTASADATQSPNQPSGQQASGQQPGSSQNSQPSSNPPQQSNGDPTDPKQLAQTLDELDRSLAAQAKGQSSDSQSASDQEPGSDPGRPSDQPSTQSQSGQQPGGQPTQGQPDDGGQQNAIDASPTLAEMLEAQSQQAARERMKSLQKAQAEQSPGDKPASQNSLPNPVSQSGEGDAPDGPQDVDLLRGGIADGDWGDLRRRGTDDAAQGRGSRIPPGYAREINAYFKAISKRAAENKQ